MSDIVIMAAGRGSRLMPLTKDKPKCMVEVNGKPIIQHLIDNIHKSKIDIDNIIIIYGYKGNVLLDYLNEVGTGFELCTILQNKLDGTAGAISLVEDIVISDNFLVLSGDIIYKPEEIKLLTKKVNSLLYTTLNKKLYEYGTLDIEFLGAPIGDVIKFINEKSSRPTSSFVNCGAYHFTKDIFDYIRKTYIDNRFDEKIITNTINLMIDDEIQFNGNYIENLNEVSYVEDIKKVEKRL